MKDHINKLDETEEIHTLKQKKIKEELKVGIKKLEK